MSVKRSLSPAIREKLLKKLNMKYGRSRTLWLMAAMVLLSLVCIFAFIRSLTESMEANISQTLLQSVEQRKINLDFRLHSLQQTDDNLIGIVYPYMSSGADRLGQYQEYAELNSILSAYTGNEYLSGVRLYVPEEKYYSHQGGTFRSLSELYNLPDADTLPYLLETGTCWLETHSVSFVNSAGRQTPTYVLTLAHSIRQRTDFDQIACVLMLDVKVSNFDDLLSDSGQPEHQGYLVNSQGVCLASPSEELLLETVLPQEIMSQFLLADSGCLEEEGRFYVYQKLSYNDWYIVMDYPSTILSISNSTQANVIQIMIIVFVVVTLTLVFITAYNYTINVTLARINTSLEALNTGELDTSADAPALPLDPLRHLQRNADLMVLTVKDLMENRYKDQIAIAESQMKSLQAQIKPHFLYNTLDVIKWMVLDDKTEDAVWMVTSLGKYLRQSINRGPGIIPLQEELELSRTYLTIMQKRFQNRFCMNFEVEDNTRDHLIPKLTLQPLLENALIHGVLYCQKPEKELTVRAWMGEHSLHIEVEDNGNGMSPETAQALQDGQVGYGVANVRIRLKLFTKDQGDFRIFSREGIGTCVAIRIPIDAKDQDPLPFR